MLQLINKINDEGIIDASTRKIFTDLNKSIQELNSKKKIKMASRSLRNRLGEFTNIWPGFVDVLATLLIV